MSDKEKINEDAVRAELDAALENMASDPEPDMEDVPAEPSGKDAGKETKGGRKNRGKGKKDDPHLHKGIVTAVEGKDVFVELGPRTQGVISIEEFEAAPEPGSEHEFSLVSIQDGLWTLSRREARTLATWRDLAKGRTVKATVIGENSGGLELKVGPVSAFMPASEVALGRVEDFLPFVGQTMVCEVMEASVRRKRVVLSRRVVLMREKRESRDRTLESLAVGQVLRGKVEKLEAFGAFVDLGGGVTGLLHVSNISHKRVSDPSTVLTLGQDVEVQVLEMKEGGKRIGLGMKQLATDPWESVTTTLRVGSVVQGKVVRIAEFGAFVEVGECVEGLLHKSQLSPDRVNRVEDVVKMGDEVAVRVQSVDQESRRISLSLLNERGARLDSDEDVGTEEMTRYLDFGSGTSSGTNLGALLREALEKKAKGPK
ncbi:MAG: S1 RNA-binding domain-containing protein [Planctomycetota bacterium]